MVTCLLTCLAKLLAMTIPPQKLVMVIISTQGRKVILLLLISFPDQGGEGIYNAQSSGLERNYRDNAGMCRSWFCA